MIEKATIHPEFKIEFEDDSCGANCEALRLGRCQAFRVPLEYKAPKNSSHIKPVRCRRCLKQIEKENPQIKMKFPKSDEVEEE